MRLTLFEILFGAIVVVLAFLWNVAAHWRRRDVRPEHRIFS